MGRSRELSEIHGWLAVSGGPRSTTALIMEGEAGIGKTELWNEALRLAADGGHRVLSCRTSPSEAHLGYVALSDLLRSCPDADFERLPDLQRRPLEVALLRAEPGEGELEPRAVGTGLLSLLEAISSQQPLLLGVDDGQWLDAASARVLAFALRRLSEAPVRLVVTIRTGEQATGGILSTAHLERELGAASIARLEVGPLSLAAIHELVRDALGVAVARPVLVRIHRAAGGNPFYALEITREVLRRGALSPGEPLPVPTDQHDVALLRLRRLPRRTREALLVVAALPRPAVGDVPPDDIAPAERAGIVHTDPSGRLSFSHPLFGSALYSSISPDERRALHARISERVETLEERALHRALAAGSADSETAELLDLATESAMRRGAADAAVELKELALRLTPADDEAAALRRERDLADRRYFAGDATGARRQLEEMLLRPMPGEDRAQVLLELGSVLWTQGEPDSGLDLLSEALEQAESTPLRARIHSRISSFSLDCDAGLEHAEAALALIDESTDPLLYSFALHNMAMWKLYALGVADHAAVELGTKLQEAAAAWEMSTLPATWARLFDDFATARRLNEDLLRAFEEAGDEASTAGILAHLAVLEAVTGHAERAAELADEALELAQQTEQETYVTLALHARGCVAAHCGDLAAARSAGEEVLRRLEAEPDLTFESIARGMLGSAALAADDAAEADRQLTRVQEILDALHTREPAADRIQADHAEAAIRLGQLERAEKMIETMEERARRLPRPWILAVSARCRGLLKAARGDVDGAIEDCRLALIAHERLDMPVERGRTMLTLGRLHRRRGERREAQACLQDALHTLEAAGALGWAETASRDLERATARRGSDHELTSTERSIAELAASGLRNDDIAAQLFVTTKTVEANLTRVYRKLGIRSRASLERRLAARRDVQGQP
ncbi:MAG: helix-turn-helix transcriptional regulator [Acidimicrobiales bacterium]